MSSKFVILILIISIIELSSSFSIVERLNESPKSDTDDVKHAKNLISSETVQQVLLKKRSTRSTKVEVKTDIKSSSKLLNSIKGRSSSSELLVEYETEADCKLKSMFLRMDELGWKNKVLAPFGFTFNYCDGQCRPVEFTPLPLIVREEGSTKLKIYENLLITKCG